jgi:hypothetical protein
MLIDVVIMRMILSQFRGEQLSRDETTAGKTDNDWPSQATAVGGENPQGSAISRLH